MIGPWIRGLLLRRPLRMWGSVTGVALTVLFLSLLLTFVLAGRANMTARAIQSVPVDWQVLLGQTASRTEAVQAIQAATPTKTILPVGYADVPGFTSRTGGTVQTTGAGVGMLAFGPLSARLGRRRTFAWMHALAIATTLTVCWLPRAMGSYGLLLFLMPLFEIGRAHV